MPRSEYQSDAELARELATEAGEALLEVRTRGASWYPDALRDEGDRVAHELLAARLAALRPRDGLRSEEAADSADRHTADRVWIVDPLDGTREFGERGRDDWAVHVALWERGELVAGAVALPALGETFGTDKPPALAPRNGRVRFVVSRNRRPRFVSELAARFDAELVPMGSAGAKVMAVVRGDVDAYLHSGGQYEWDSAAPVAVATATGLHAARLDGSPLRYNRSDPWLPDLFVCHPTLAEPLQAALSDTRS
ncbi:3'(2'),5'-bisphosphate nucleotidase CysQ [Pseudonocardia spinosispora]|uniref:3'(2'),5'-bisphosphate nucleotidase CysQ n=1 Tax=Pseudonocardia spinosispora TaxID=103441 RepID=UPI0003FCBC5A|nr:3'(2'),5'-bisphosphate nucleotidase CysQ [Pseudonocardia spinosispora]